MTERQQLNLLAERRREANELLERLVEEQGVRPYRDFAELMEGIGPPEPGERDLYDVIIEERARRRAAPEKKDWWEL